MSSEHYKDEGYTNFTHNNVGDRSLEEQDAAQGFVQFTDEMKQSEMKQSEQDAAHWESLRSMHMVAARQSRGSSSRWLNSLNVSDAVRRWDEQEEVRQKELEELNKELARRNAAKKEKKSVKNQGSGSGVKKPDGRKRHRGKN